MNMYGTLGSRTKVFVSSVALSVVAMFGVGFAATSAWAASPAASSMPEAYLRVLARAATEVDQLPVERDGVPYADGAGLLYDTSRFLGSTDHAEYWVVANELGHICLVIALTQNGDSSMACVTKDRFGREGVAGAVTSLRDGEERGYAEGYLVPDSLHFASIPGGLGEVSANLVGGDSRGQKGTLTSRTENGDAEMDMQLIHPNPAS